jgi:hypothetical protein
MTFEERVKNEAKIIKFLRAHPYSTAGEIYKAVGSHPGMNPRFLTQSQAYRGQKRKTFWCVNELKYRRYLRTFKITGRSSND